MTGSEPGSFVPLAGALRSAIVERHGVGGAAKGAISEVSLDTNSAYVERRASPLEDLYLKRSKRSSLEGVSVADLGCGFGALSIYFAFRGASVHGVDPNADRLEVGRAVAAEHDLPVHLTRGRMEDSGLATGSFDLAIMNNSLCYLVERTQRLRALQAAFSLLAPGGWIIVRNPNRLHPVDQFTGLPLLHLAGRRLATATARRLGRKRSAVQLLGPLGSRRELARAGFSDVLVEFPANRVRRSPAWPLSRYLHVSGRRPR